MRNDEIINFIVNNFLPLITQEFLLKTLNEKENNFIWKVLLEKSKEHEIKKFIEDHKLSAIFSAGLICIEEGYHNFSDKLCLEFMVSTNLAELSKLNIPVWLTPLLDRVQNEYVIAEQLKIEQDIKESNRIEEESAKLINAIVEFNSQLIPQLRELDKQQQSKKNSVISFDVKDFSPSIQEAVKKKLVNLDFIATLRHFDNYHLGGYDGTSYYLDLEIPKVNTLDDGKKFLQDKFLFVMQQRKLSIVAPPPFAAQFSKQSTAVTTSFSSARVIAHPIGNAPEPAALDKVSFLQPRSMAERLEDIDYQGEIPSSYLCYATACIMTSPVVSDEGYCYEEAVLRAMLDINSSIRPNKALKEVILKFVEQQESIFKNENEKRKIASKTQVTKNITLSPRNNTINYYSTSISQIPVQTPHVLDISSQPSVVFKNLLLLIQNQINDQIKLYPMASSWSVDVTQLSSENLLFIKKKFEDVQIYPEIINNSQGFGNPMPDSSNFIIKKDDLMKLNTTDEFFVNMQHTIIKEERKINEIKNENVDPAPLQTNMPVSEVVQIRNAQPPSSLRLSHSIEAPIVTPPKVVNIQSKTMHHRLENVSCSEIPYDYVCPITLEIMSDPVTDTDGNSFERSALEAWLDGGHSTSPKSRAPLAKSDLRPNLTLKNIIAEFVETTEKNAAAKNQNNLSGSCNAPLLPNKVVVKIKGVELGGFFDLNLKKSALKRDDSQKNRATKNDEVSLHSRKL